MFNIFWLKYLLYRTYYVFIGDEIVESDEKVISQNSTQIHTSSGVETGKQ